MQDDQPDAINLDTITSVEQLAELGMDVLKRELSRRFLKCGGSLNERAQRLFSVKGLVPSQIPDTIKAGKSKGGKSLTSESVFSSPKYRTIALVEAKISLISELLQDVLDATVQRVVKNQARTYAEIEMQLELEEKLSSDEEVEVVEEEDEDDRPSNKNPLKIPLGYDGKPIPYWLYKLHGLGIEYTCEICGHYSYWGRRAFEKHFQEWRHAHAMRLLKIPNTKHFHEITNIEDAFTLYEKIKGDLMGKAWRSDVEEEFEDTEGNVLNKKTYDDLQRQGLL
eukprot:c2716_g1_i3.p1 GENE.c2716_g1_i3~~c2716_g1_i3.p1  ORF type:complete len:281 (+),score=91.12 c2716_g1_i3:844-1686(+)